MGGQTLNLGYSNSLLLAINNSIASRKHALCTLKHLGDHPPLQIAFAQRVVCSAVAVWSRLRRPQLARRSQGTWHGRPMLKLNEPQEPVSAEQ